jgi:hypothetical protein
MRQATMPPDEFLSLSIASSSRGQRTYIDWNPREEKEETNQPEIFLVFSGTQRIERKLKYFISPSNPSRFCVSAVCHNFFNETFITHDLPKFSIAATVYM